MLLTIIIPVYNTQKYLKKCVDSILFQALEYSGKIEIFIVNDGSTDDSLFVMLNYKQMYQNIITVIDKPNEGVSKARNVAIESSSGDYVWFIDSDDMVEEGALLQIMPILELRRVDYLMFNAHIVNCNGDVIGEFIHENKVDCIYRFKFTCSDVHKKIKKHMVWLKIYRRDFIKDIEFPDGITHEDIHFDIRVLAHSPLVYFLSNKLYRHYFDNPTSITNTMNHDKILHVLWIFLDLKNKFESSPRLKASLGELKALVVCKLILRLDYVLTMDLPFFQKINIYHKYSNAVAEIADVSCRGPLRENLDLRLYCMARLIQKGYGRISYFVFYLSIYVKKAKEKIFDKLYRKHGLTLEA